MDSESLGDSVFDAPIPSFNSSRQEQEERDSDSGCSSEKSARNSVKEEIPKVSYLSSSPVEKRSVSSYVITYVSSLIIYRLLEDKVMNAIKAT